MTLKELRESKGLVQEDLAQLLGVQASTICRYETGKRIPDIEMLDKIAHIFGISRGEAMDLFLPKSMANCQQ